MGVSKILQISFMDLKLVFFLEKVPILIHAKISAKIRLQTLLLQMLQAINIIHVRIFMKETDVTTD